MESGHMRLRRCNYPNCRVAIQRDNHYCPKHELIKQKEKEDYLTKQRGSSKGSLRDKHDNKKRQQAYDLNTRDEEATKFYHSTKWVRTANYIRNKESYSSGVSGNILNDTEIQVDHIIKRELLSQEKWTDTDNLWLLSRKEHQLKTTMERKMIRDGKANVLKHLTRQWWAKVLKERLYN